MLRFISRAGLLVGILLLLAGICSLVGMSTVLDILPNSSIYVESLACQEGWHIEERYTNTGSGVGTSSYCISPTGDEVNVSLKTLLIYFGIPLALSIVGGGLLAVAVVAGRIGGPAAEQPFTINLSGKP